MIHVLQDIYVLRMCVTFEYYLYIGTSIDVCITRHTRITHILRTFVTITHIYAHTCLVTHTSPCANVTYMYYIHVLHIYMHNTHVLLTFVTIDVRITRHTRIAYVCHIHVLHIYMHT